MVGSSIDSSADSSQIIKVEKLSKSYGPNTAISDISFSVRKGDVVGFLGPNGAGKSTTMKIITGSMAPSSGSVEVAGYDVFEDPIEVKRRIGYLPETPPVYGEMSVRSYLEFVGRLKGVEPKALQTQVKKAIEKTDLGSVEKRLIQNLSKGFRQRVGIAQALVSDPEILILDEPTSGLDPKQVSEVRALIKELSGEHTIVLSTHILPEVQAMCERIIIISRGRIVAEDTLEGLKARMNPSTRVRMKCLRLTEGLVSKLKSHPQVASVNETGDSLMLTLTGVGKQAEPALEAVAELAVSERAGLIELVRESANLEEIFIELTTKEAVVQGGVL